MAINTVSSTKAADLHAQQQASAKPKAKSNDFSTALASAAASAPTPAPTASAKQVNNANPIQSGDGTKANA